MLEQQDFDTYDISIISHRLKSAAGDFTKKKIEKKREKTRQIIITTQFFLGLNMFLLCLRAKN